MATIPSLSLFLPDLEATQQLGRRLGELVRAGDVILLEGDLGAGKTSLAQGLAAGLGIECRVGSPTFTLVNQYRGRLPFHHLDLYRLEPGDAERSGFQEYWEDGDGVVAIEWPDRLLALPDRYLHVQLAQQGEGRMAGISAVGAGMETLLDRLDAPDQDADPGH